MSTEIPLTGLNVNIQEIEESIAKVGLLNTARLWGYKVENYDNLLAAGHMLMKDIQNNAAQNLAQYLQAMEGRMNKKCKDFFNEHYSTLEKVWKENADRDYIHDWFSASTLARTYLTKLHFNEEPIETPQLMYLRIAVQLFHDKGIDRVIKAYHEMSTQYYTHASPTIFNSGMKKHQLASCFLSTIDDNLESILYEGVGDAGMISRHNGGLGIDISRIRHSEIAGAGMSGGVVPMLQVYNSMIRYVDQGGKRRGAMTVFLRPHHIDIYEFVEIVDKIGDKYARAHDLNTALWTPWIFWERVRKDEDWTLFCPHHTPKLNDSWGIEFETEYIKYEQLAKQKHEEYTQIEEAYKTMQNEIRLGVAKDRVEFARLRDLYSKLKFEKIPFKTVKARHLLNHIVTIQQKAGMPYIMHADSCNFKSNQRSLGYIRGSNLCVEIVEFSSSDEIASCNLASLNLRAYAKGKCQTFDTEGIVNAYDFNKLAEMTQSVVENLNQVINHNWYPLDKVDSQGNIIQGKIHKPNKKHRPIGLGVSGFAEALHILDIPFVNSKNSGLPDETTSQFNKLLFACIYFNALAKSVDLSVQNGPYETFQGSPLSEGKLQFDLWAEEFKLRGPNPVRSEKDDLPVDPSEFGQKEITLSNGYIIKPTWDSLREAIVTFGVRNSLLIALMPTATTAQILRNAETCEAHMSNIYSRKVMNGGYPVINRFMIQDLNELQLWNQTTLSYLQSKSGSLEGFDQFIQDHPDYPESVDQSRLKHVMLKYKTMWELSQKIFLKLAADRGRYVCQSQSTNVYIAEPTNEQLMALHSYTDMLGLKTGMYYLRMKPATETIKFTVDPEILRKVKTLAQGIQEDDSENSGGCLMCQ